MEINHEQARQLAKVELEQELFREAVDRYKTKLREAKWYHKLFPWKIVIIKREL